MKTIRILGQPEPENAWLHRFRNFGEDVYVRLGGTYAVDIEEIDSSIDRFHVGGIPAGRATGVSDMLESIVREHHLDGSVFVLPHDPWRSGPTVVLVLDPAFGDRLWEIGARHDTWVVPSDVNRSAVEEMWRARTEGNGGPPVTIWSKPTPAVTEADWLAILGTIEIHHGAEAGEPALEMLSVYGAAATPPVAAALKAYDYDAVKPTGAGFVAFKRPKT